MPTAARRRTTAAGRTAGDPVRRNLQAIVGSLPAVSGDWGSGRLLQSALFSVLITDDGGCSPERSPRSRCTRQPRSDLAGDADRPTASAAARRAEPAEPARTGGFAVTSTGLTKRFRGGQIAVDHIDLAVPAGAVYGFLGPNGSGKTTTIRMLLGLVRPTSGSHTLLGGRIPEDSQRVLPRVGALVEGPAFHPYLSGRDNLRRLDAADRTADPATCTAASPARSTGSAWPPPPASGTATTRSACASGWASPPRCCSPASC